MNELINAVKKGKEAEEMLLKSYEDLILSLTKKRCRLNIANMTEKEEIEFNKIYEAAKKGFIQGILKLSSKNENEINFKSYVTWWIKMGISKYHAQNSKMIVLPANRMK